jgi:lipoprotein-releasing system permease protein
LNLSLYIARRLQQQKGPSFSRTVIRITIIAIALSVAVMLTATCLILGFQAEIKNKLFGIWGGIQIVNYSENRSYENEGFVLSDSVLKAVQQTRGITHLQEFAIKPGILKTKESLEGLVLKGVSSTYDFTFIRQYLTDSTIKNGESLIHFQDSSAAPQIILSSYTANRMHLKCGDGCYLYFIDKVPRVRKFKISALYKTALEDFDKTYALVDIRHIQKLNSWKLGQVGGYELFIQPTANADSVATVLNDHVLPAVLYAATLRSLKPQLFDWLDLQNTNELVILIVMSVVAIINIISTLLILILERTRMIGLLKSMGMKNHGLRTIFLYQASFILFRGLLWGNVVGIGLCAIQYYFKLLQLPEETYYISYAPIYFNLWWMLLINLATVLVCIFTLIIPSFLINFIRPVKAISFE